MIEPLIYRDVASDTSFRITGLSSVRVMIASSINVIGRSAKKGQLPSLIVSARLRLSSSIPPRINPSNNGAIGNPRTLRTKADMATRTIR